jgi:ABC-2 type transport system permease protein
MNVRYVFLVKEMRDLRHNGQVLAINLLMPTVSVAIMVLAAGFGGAILTVDANDPVVIAMARQATTSAEFAGMPQDMAFTAFTLRGLLAFYLLMPVVLSSTIAAYSIVGEKQQRTLEPVLATSLSDREFLLAKMIAALVPAIVITWLSAVLAAIAVSIITWTKWHVLLVPDRYWLVALLLLAPALAVGSVLATMRMSARATDPQAAVQTSAIFLLPAFLIVVSIVGRLALQDATIGVLVATLIVVIDISLFRTNVRRFGREEILTRWK